MSITKTKITAIHIVAGDQDVRIDGELWRGDPEFTVHVGRTVFRAELKRLRQLHTALSWLIEEYPE